MSSATLFGKPRIFVLPLVLFSFLIAQAQNQIDGMEPAASPYGTLGMSSIVSAEPMGSGRLTLQLRGNAYPQERTFPGAPKKNAQIISSTGAVAFGMNPYMDAFATLAAYNIRNSPVAENGSGLGASALGLQGSIPISKTLPAYLGIQLATLLGTSKREIDSNGVDGYDYMESRTFTDVMARLTQSFIFMDDQGLGIKVHFNEGLLSSFQPGKDISILSGVGFELHPFSIAIFGVELNSRTLSKKPGAGDPFWITPSFTLLTPFHLNVATGADFSLSKDRSGPTTTRALEPWRAFGSITFSYDLLAQKRRDAAEKARLDSLEKVALLDKIKSAQIKAEELARMDSLDREQRKITADSIAAANAAAMAAKAYQDSLNLAEAKRLLDEERSKRSDAEKQLLSTGEILLDAVYFETGKTDVSINSQSYLNVIAKMLMKYPKLQVEISGHTDNVGSVASNMRLSQGRAESVVRYIVGAFPSLQGMLTAKGYGFSQPKGDNKTAAGKKLNRRTELKVLNKDALIQYNPD